MAITAIATVVEGITTLLTVGGLVYMILALLGARDFNRAIRRMLHSSSNAPGFAPDVSILKPLKGVDGHMYAGFVSHCQQRYAGRFEILFGVTSMDDPEVAEIERLRAEFPDREIRLIDCTERLGTSGKVSSLIQMLRQARYDYVLINDSDIRVGPNYLSRVMACFAEAKKDIGGPPIPPKRSLDGAPGAENKCVGMVTAPYIGRTARDGKGLTL